MRRWTLMLMCITPCLASPGNAAADCADVSLTPARVAQVYPTAEELPANLLRLYVYFTQPMERADDGGHVTLRDEAGEVMPGALLKTRFGLWSSDGRRLTVLLDPGRVKTGLAAHERFGPVLEQGRRYTLRIDPTLRDANGCSMADGHEKAFTAGAPDRHPPSPADWSLALPPVHTREALTVVLSGPTDHLSLAYRVRVLDAQQQGVPGAIELAQHEQVWRFSPAQTWRAGTYTLRVDPKLEDLAGNRPTGLFDDPTSANRERSAQASSFDRIFVLTE
ncbi:MAG: hypothetical protein AAF184_24050 [Pseudomonadota bacterium]